MEPADTPQWPLRRLLLGDEPVLDAAGREQLFLAAAGWPAGHRWALIVSPAGESRSEAERLTVESAGAQPVALFGSADSSDAGPLQAEKLGRESRFVRPSRDPCPGPRLILYRW